MIKGITKDQHLLLDYAYVPLVLSTPSLLHFEDEKWASNACYILSATVLGYSLLTDAKWGAVKLIPYKTHAALDLMQGVAAVGAAFVGQKQLSTTARNTFLALGITGIAVGILSLIGAKKG
jgi:hypothetical protein